jgi:hypothetical protein
LFEARNISKKEGTRSILAMMTSVRSKIVQSFTGTTVQILTQQAMHLAVLRAAARLSLRLLALLSQSFTGAIVQILTQQAMHPSGLWRSAARSRTPLAR